MIKTAFLIRLLLNYLLVYLHVYSWKITLKEFGVVLVKERILQDFVNGNCLHEIDVARIVFGLDVEKERLRRTFTV